MENIKAFDLLDWYRNIDLLTVDNLEVFKECLDKAFKLPDYLQDSFMVHMWYLATRENKEKAVEDIKNSIKMMIQESSERLVLVQGTLPWLIIADKIFSVEPEDLKIIYTMMKDCITSGFVEALYKELGAMEINEVRCEEIKHWLVTKIRW